MGHSLKGGVDLMRYNCQSEEDLKKIYDKVMCNNIGQIFRRDSIQIYLVIPYLDAQNCRENILIRENYIQNYDIIFIKGRIL